MERVTTDEYLIAEESPIVRMTTKELQANLAEIVKQVATEDERVILSQDGKDMAAVISIEAFWFLERIVAKIEDEIDVKEAEKILAQTKPEDYIPFEQVRKELGLA